MLFANHVWKTCMNLELNIQSKSQNTRVVAFQWELRNAKEISIWNVFFRFWRGLVQIPVANSYPKVEHSWDRLWLVNSLSWTILWWRRSRKMDPGMYLIGPDWLNSRVRLRSFTTWNLNAVVLPPSPQSWVQSSKDPVRWCAIPCLRTYMGLVTGVEDSRLR